MGVFNYDSHAFLFNGAYSLQTKSVADILNHRPALHVGTTGTEYLVLRS